MSHYTLAIKFLKVRLKIQKANVFFKVLSSNIQSLDRCLITRGGGVPPEKLGRGVRPASQKPYPIYDQNLRYSLPYL